MIKFFHLNFVAASACAFAASMSIPAHAGFSLGVRPYVGSESVTIPGTTLVNPTNTSEKYSKDQTVQRPFLFFGGDLAITPVELGSLSFSALVGFRMMKNATTEGTVNDTLNLKYVPIGVSVDYAIKKVRASGYFTYDLGIGPQFILSVKNPASSLDLKMSGLSRLRFGGFAEFFIMKSLSVFGMGDYAMGSFKTESGPLQFNYTDPQTNTETPLDVLVVGSQSKLSALTFGAGIAYYIPAPSSQSGGVPSNPDTKPSGKKPAGKGAPKKAKPKPKPKVDTETPP